MRLEPAGKNIVDGFAGTHGQGAHEDRFSVRCFGVAPIKRVGDILDPFFFF
jgi:hypothetical protein